MVAAATQIDFRVYRALTIERFNAHPVRDYSRIVNIENRLGRMENETIRQGRFQLFNAMIDCRMARS
jgi:hypothetical protein